MKKKKKKTCKRLPGNYDSFKKVNANVSMGCARKIQFNCQPKSNVEWIDGIFFFLRCVATVPHPTVQQIFYSLSMPLSLVGQKSLLRLHMQPCASRCLIFVFIFLKYWVCFSICNVISDSKHFSVFLNLMYRFGVIIDGWTKLLWLSTP